MYRILVADDDPLMRELIEAILMRDGHQVTLVTTGSAAMEKVESEAFDLVVADIFMPGGTGLALLVSMREKDIQLPFICVSGGDGSLFRPYASTMTSLGAVSVLRKPFTPDQLLAALKRAMEEGAI